jgi:hypothetical protein
MMRPVSADRMPCLALHLARKGDEPQGEKGPVTDEERFGHTQAVAAFVHAYTANVADMLGFLVPKKRSRRLVVP